MDYVITVPDRVANLLLLVQWLFGSALFSPTQTLRHHASLVLFRNLGSLGLLLPTKQAQLQASSSTAALRQVPFH
ncbi:hypothetical protein BJ138DRAFT_1160467 [Hygrophoropsis aurantiaca]|uniref:Uncharacterized protein n=1 Tax=Hygrophoropsis aurantiaca TaxID=72124 RepID=A0ACB8A2T8_9AGAM|nr:hypothetical protein BJ138DRAFT_1160467 [Hygrophoropsis aurantiaca]